MNVKIFIGLFILIILSILGTKIVKPWEVPNNNTEKIKRSLYFGLYNCFIILCIIMVFGWQNEGITIKKIQGLLGIFLCIGIPFGIISIFGYYIGYKQIGWLMEKRSRIANNNKPNEEEKNN